MLNKFREAEAIIPYREQNHREHFHQGEPIRAVLKRVEETPKGPRLILSRADPLFVKALFKLEVPEIQQNIVDIRAAAREVGRMMELTTRIGTAKGTFRDKRGRRLLPVEVAGKTGTLSAETDHGYVGYSWFVGYAPADHPAIAFAVVLGNNPNWRIKATYVGRHIVSTYLAATKPAVPRLLASK